MNIFVKCFVVRTSDGDTYYFSTEEKADKAVDSFPPDLGYAYRVGTAMVDRDDLSS